MFGHPTGLFTLFFAEMWERFSFYGMRALLVFYMVKGFLGYNDSEAYAVYGAYGALVYMTPYFGGMLADRVLGQRRAVVLGGLLMAAGHLLMTVEHSIAFFGALALIICGNGFFKPNISTMVGSLYPKVSEKKDTGFTIFYMGINLGAALAPILCGYVGAAYGWHYGFGLATGGMLIGVGIFVMPTRLTQLLVVVGALGTSIAMPFLQDFWLQLVVRLVLAAALTAGGIIAFTALGRGGLPDWAGAPPDPKLLTHKLGGFLRVDFAVYLGALLAVPFFALIVQRNEIAKWVLVVTGGGALIYILYDAFAKCTKVERERIFVVLVLFFFSMLFWAFFEQAGSSVNNFTDRNVDRVLDTRPVTQQDVGSTVRFRIPLRPRDGDEELDKLPLLSQEQLGHRNADPRMKQAIKDAVRAAEKRRAKLKPEEIDGQVAAVDKYAVLTMSGLAALRTAAGQEGAPTEHKVVDWKVAPENVGMGIGDAEIPAAEFQAANPMFILLFGLVFSALWSFLAARKRDPSPPLKFSLGLLQLGLGFGAFWYGAQQADGRGMGIMSWLLLGYLLQTTGELCLSPVGLSAITKLSPTRMVSTMMGGWFLSTGISNYLAGAIAALTGVSHGGGGAQWIPPPTETVNIYGDVFGTIALTAGGAAVLCFILSPLLKKWMHIGVEEEPEADKPGSEPPDDDAEEGAGPAPEPPAEGEAAS